MPSRFLYVVSLVLMSGGESPRIFLIMAFRCSAKSLKAARSPYSTAGIGLLSRYCIVRKGGMGGEDYLFELGVDLAKFEDLFFGFIHG